VRPNWPAACSDASASSVKDAKDWFSHAGTGSRLLCPADKCIKEPSGVRFIGFRQTPSGFHSKSRATGRLAALSRIRVAMEGYPTKEVLRDLIAGKLDWPRVKQIMSS
jgi:hypothetical protein